MGATIKPTQSPAIIKTAAKIQNIGINFVANGKNVAGEEK